jgi:hypothetical protein
MGNQQRFKWMAKDSVYSAWRELPGLYTASEIFAMSRRGEFLVALPAPATEVLEPSSVLQERDRKQA